jgi:hypothetical protein
MIRVELFVAVLGASNYTYAEATAPQQTADLLLAHAHAVEYFGGVPQVVVPDQLRTGIGPVSVRTAAAAQLRGVGRTLRHPGDSREAGETSGQSDGRSGQAVAQPRVTSKATQAQTYATLRRGAKANRAPQCFLGSAGGSRKSEIFNGGLTSTLNRQTARASVLPSRTRYSAIFSGARISPAGR